MPTKEIRTRQATPTPGEVEPLYGDDGPPLRSGNVVTMERCTRRWVLQVLHGWRPIARAAALDIGSYTHHGVGAAFTAKMADPALRTEDARRTMRDAIKTKHDGMVTDLTKRRYPANLPDTELKDYLIEARKGLACAVRLYKEFDVLFREANLEVIAVEMPLPNRLTLDLGDNQNVTVTVGFGGQLDALVATADRKHVFIADWKTDGKSASTNGRLYQWRIQAYLYWLAVEAMARGGIAPVLRAVLSGFYHGVILTPGIRLKGIHTEKPQTIADYMRECDEWWDGTGRHAKQAAKRQTDPPTMVHRMRMTPGIELSGRARIRRYVHNSQEYTKGYATAPLETILAYVPMSELSCNLQSMPCPYAKLCLEPRGECRSTLTRCFTRSADPLDSDPSRVPTARPAGVPTKVPDPEVLGKKEEGEG